MGFYYPLVLLPAVALGQAWFEPTNEPNMNGDYVIGTTPGGTKAKDLFPKAYRDYPGGVEYYDSYSPPMTTLYSQVWWSPLKPTPMPDAMVKKYAGKAMAIVGWEIDQVRRTPDGDVSVPISATYNHHYVSHMIGAGARFKKVMLDGPDDPLAPQVQAQSHGHVAWDQPHYVVEELETPTNGGATSQRFSSANGGEYRKSYHGFPPGYALVLDSPTAWQITPMQIDTWNRDKMNITAAALKERNGLPPRFVPGPLPRASLAPTDPAYSGLLECPLTTRISKALDGTYTAQSTGGCDADILTFQECFHAAAGLFGAGDAEHTFVNTTSSDATQPPGCSAAVDPATPLTVRVLFNKLASSTTACGAHAEAVAGTVASLVRVSVQLNATTKQAAVTLEGPADVWFGAGFGARTMADASWTVVVDGAGAVTERKLAKHAAGSVLTPSITVESNVVDKATGLRTVVVSRPLEGVSGDYFTFSMAAEDTTVPLLVAVGSSSAYAYHKDKAPTQITLLPVAAGAGVGACVCPQQPKPFGDATGNLVYHATAQKEDTGEGAVGFSANKCPHWPRTNIRDNMTNPTCDIRHYRGGQWACHHMWSLLDADQTIPWVDQPLVFHHKYRFWVQPYNESYHTKLTLGEMAGSALLIGSPWELDVPKCAPGVLGCSLQDGTWIHTIKGNKIGSHNFVALNFHCHAPTCLSMSVYACDKGTALADCDETVGKLLCETLPAYGGTGNPALKGTRFDEPGYIAIPDCFWGGAEYGLEPPIDVTGVPLHMVKTSNATWGHYGEMAGGQPWVY